MELSRILQQVLSMEVEAKFSLPDQECENRLRVTRRLAGFSLAEGRSTVVHDTYMDTEKRAILAGGYACRFRQEAGGIRITLKAVGKAAGAIHTREEMEVLLPALAPLEEWPDAALREKVLQLAHGEPLASLFELHQTRFVRPVRRNGNAIAELSLDSVHVTAGDREQSYSELEVELTKAGNEEQLARIAGILQNKWQLHPETLSKFERALGLLDSESEVGPAPVPDSEILIRIAERDDWHGLRSRALLALTNGLSVSEVGKQAGRSRRTIGRWMAAFQRSSLGIFPSSILEGLLQPATRRRTETQAAARAPILAPVLEPPAPKIKLLDRPGILADDVIAEVARKTLYFQFQRMLYHEPGTRLGQDNEELHDMRVATRRMRAALRVFGPYLDEKAWAPFEKGLRRTGRVLGRVRDLDVFWEKTQRYLDGLPPERQDELSGLHAVWQAEREKARERLLSYLAGARYAQFKDSFAEFLETPEAGAPPAFGKAGKPRPRRLRHVAPMILYQGLADMLAFEEWTAGPEVPLARLHQLRIASKGLRYSLEFLEEVLGQESKPLVKNIKALQDHLGNLQDAVVASNLLRDFLTWGTWGHDPTKKTPPLPVAPVVAPGVATYLAARQAELQQLPASFPTVWSRIQSPAFKQGLASALAAL
ncbi:MAG: CHAD domain-containing protein [Bacteroidota bacterium]